MCGLIIFLPREPWATVVSIAMLFPLLLWLAARCRPVFSAAASFIVAFTIVWTTTFGIGTFGDSNFPSHRTNSCGPSLHIGGFAVLARTCCAVFRAATAPGRAQGERGANAGTEASLRNRPDRSCISHSRLPIFADQPAFDGNLRDFSRRPYWPHGAGYGPASRRPGRKYRSAILRTGESITGIEVNGQRPDGGNAERVWVTNWHPLKAADGGILGVNVVAEEITERKRAEAALAASETRFRELADNMSQFAWTADAQGSTYWYNKRWHDYAGTTLEEMQGWGWQKVHHPDHVDRVVVDMRQCFRGRLALGRYFSTSWQGRHLPLVSVARATYPQRGRRTCPLVRYAHGCQRTDRGRESAPYLERNVGAARRNGGSGAGANLERIAGSSGRCRHGRPICRDQSGMADDARLVRRQIFSTRPSNGWSIPTIWQKRERSRLASPAAAIRCISKIVSGISMARTAGCRGKRSPRKARSMLSPATLPISRIRRINCEFRAANSPR